MTKHIEGEDVDGPGLLACARSADAKRMNATFQKMCSDKALYDTYVESCRSFMADPGFGEKEIVKACDVAAERANSEVNAAIAVFIASQALWKEPGPAAKQTKGQACKAAVDTIASALQGKLPPKLALVLKRAADEGSVAA